MPQLILPLEKLANSNVRIQFEGATPTEILLGGNRNVNVLSPNDPTANLVLQLLVGGSADLPFHVKKFERHGQEPTTLTLSDGSEYRIHHTLRTLRGTGDGQDNISYVPIPTNTYLERQGEIDQIFKPTS
ncbi:hypothetical protein HYY71_07030 [Candidatus Woesearchaeota archaeon]|nr:hypothetical protein [Candidatus Woesearchaeota archaeon]